MRIKSGSNGIGFLGTAAIAIALTLPSCNDGSRSTISHLECNGDFGTSVEARRLESFVGASAAFYDGVIATETDLLATCHAMGVELGMSDAEIFEGGIGSLGRERLRYACTNVDARIRAELTEITAGSTVFVDLQSTPPRCDVSVDAYASCVAACDVTVDPGSVEVMCDGGELRGECTAECTGSCAASVDAACSGTCEGYCEGSCTARSEDGSCAGACDGTCHGQCVVDTSVHCAGECRGACSVAFRAPRCTGDLRAPMATATCQADCDARIAAEVMCTPGETHLVITGSIGTDAIARADRLRAAFEVGAASMFALHTHASIIAGASVVLVSTAANAASDASSLGAAAVGCAAAAAVDVANAAASLEVSVSVSVMVSGTISGTAR